MTKTKTLPRINRMLLIDLKAKLATVAQHMAEDMNADHLTTADADELVRLAVERCHDELNYYRRMRE
jgi:hypothetical protein